MATTAISASMLKRVAEAADGYRSGEEVWVVAEHAFPHDAEVFKREADAKIYLSKASNLRQIFGPFVSGNSHSQFGERPEVSAIVGTVTEGGKSKQVQIHPKACDSIFWSAAAFDKFVFPYYASLYGVD